MKGYSLKIALIFALICGTTYIIFPWNSVGLTMSGTGPDYKLGLDLHGGVELDYRIDLEEAKKKGDYNEQNITEGLKTIVEKRVNSLGTAEPTIVTSKYGNESHIIVQIPTSNFAGENLTQTQIKQKNDEYIAKAKETIGKVVRLEFKEKKTQATEQDKQERRKIIEAAKKDLNSKELTFKVVGNKYKDQYENVSYLSGTGNSLEIPGEATFTGMENVKTPFISEIIDTAKKPSYSLGADGQLQMGESEKGFSIIKINNISKVQKEKEVTEGTGTTAKKKTEKYEDTVYDYEVIFVSEKPSEWTPAKTADGKTLDERYLIKATANMSNGLQPEVDLTFNSDGAKIFAELTKRLIGQPLAIYVGGELLTAPTVQSVIPDGKAQITGNYSVDSAKKLANDINTGIVPAPIYLTSERTIDAKIGGDSLNSIIYAGIIGFLFILTFLVIAYRVSGLLAGVSLIAYITMTIAIVKFSGVVLTLASIAGLVLSVGLAIDANILIFERTKEDLRKKTEITKAINIGFDRSWSAIWDAHVTTLVSAVILWFFGVNMISGFGYMLGIGILVSLFSAMWISRILILAFAPIFKDKINTFIGLK